MFNEAGDGAIQELLVFHEILVGAMSEENVPKARSVSANLVGQGRTAYQLSVQILFYTTFPTR